MLNEYVKKALDNIIDENQFISKGEATHDLKSCLNSRNSKTIDAIYNNIKYIIFKEDDDENISQKDKIQYLIKKIPEAFEEFFMYVNEDDLKIINDVVDNKNSKNSNITLLYNGFLYGFLDNEKEIFIMPDELISIYNKKYSKKKRKEKDLKDMEFFIDFYLLINSIFPIDTLNDFLINRYQLDVTKEEIKDALKNDKYKIYQDKYYYYSNSDEAIDLIEIKNGDYQFVEKNSAADYMFFIEDLLNDLEKILGKEKQLAEKILITIKYNPKIAIDDNLLINILEKDTNLSSKTIDKIDEIVAENFDKIRMWYFNGSTIKERSFEIASKNLCLNKLPEDNDLFTCLNSLTKEGYDYLLKNYNVNKKNSKELKKMILENFKNYLEQADKLEMYNLLNIITEHSGDSYYLDNGFVFVFQEDNEYKYFFPTDIYDLLKSKISNEFMSNENIDVIVNYYVYANGVIKKDKLLELLEKNHNIIITEEELVKIIKDENINIYKDEYYAFIADIDDKLIEDIMPLKEQYKDYKVANLMDENFENLYTEEMESFLIDTLKLDSNKANELAETTLCMINQNLFNMSMIPFICEDYNITKKSDIEKITEIIKKYRNDIPIWIYNGFSIKEYNQRKTQIKKVGRNNPCPCGSGKKYKKCCGK